MRILNCVFIAAFILMLTLPLVFVDLSSDRVSVQENRMLAQRPRIADIKNRPGVFVREFDAWFKDSTGFRERLVVLYNIMGRSKWYNSIRYTDGQYIYLIGEEGHIYVAGGGGYLINKFQGKQFLTDEQLMNMAARLDEVKTYLNNKGIPLIVMFCTDKESVYPEFYPKSIKRGPEPIQLDVITNYLQEHTSIDVFNIRQALIAKKNNYMLYPLIDNLSSAPKDFFHYNDIGAFFAYRELMRHINFYLPEIIPYELDDVDISYDENGTPLVLLRAYKVYKKLDASFFDDININRPYTYPPWENEAYENIEADSPVILFFHDSYAHEWYIGKYIAQHFGKAIFIHYLNMEYFDEYINRYKPHIVIFETVERHLSWFADLVARIPKLP